MRPYHRFGELLAREAKSAKLSPRLVRIFTIIGAVCGGLVALGYTLVSTRVAPQSDWISTFTGYALAYGTLGALITFCAVGIARIKTQTGRSLLQTISITIGKVLLFLFLPSLLLALIIYFAVTLSTPARN